MNDSQSSITVVRIVKAPVKDVFAAWTDPKLFARWMAPGKDNVGRAEVDARVGGKYRIELKTSTGDVHVTTGEYLELVPNRRIVKTWKYDGPLEDFTKHVTQLTVEFRELQQNRTELTLTHARAPSKSYIDSIRAGWGECLNALEDLLTNEDFGATPDGSTLRFRRVLPGPIERVWSYLTDSDKRAKWLAAGPMELRPGGKMELHFLHSSLSAHKEQPPERYKQYENGAGFSGHVTRAEAPKVLSITWGESDGGHSEVTFELTPQGKDVLLLLTHRRIATRKDMVETAAGWHTHLDILLDHLNGLEPQPFWSKHARVEDAYEQRIAAG